MKENDRTRFRKEAMRRANTDSANVARGGRHMRRWLIFMALILSLLPGLVGCGETERQEVTSVVPKTTTAEDLGQYGLSGAKNEEVSFGLPEFTIHGTLSIPDKDKKKYPAVVLVGGSGPTDRDETVGANKVFRDLSQNLVKAGVAVLRYDKRTLTYLNKMSEQPEIYKNLTIQHEVVDDAVFAVQFLHADPRIDSSKIYIIGHSLGGNLAPEIARVAGEGKVAGIVMMAANVTPIWEAIVRQSEYIAGLDGVIDEIEKQQIELYRQARSYIGSPTFNKSSDFRKTLQVYPAYWLSLKEYDALKTAQELNSKIKIMVAQGGRDYQVTVDEFKMWKAALGDRAEYFLYDNLNHLFIEGKGKSTPQEYMTEGSISKDFLDDLVEFLLGW